MFELATKFRRMVERCGPVIMIPQKTRLVFMVRMRFAGYTARRSALRVSLILERRLPPDPRLELIETYGTYTHGHYFRIESPRQLDATMQQWIREAYDRGRQKNFERRGRSARRKADVE